MAIAPFRFQDVFKRLVEVGWGGQLVVSMNGLAFSSASAMFDVAPEPGSPSLVTPVGTFYVDSPPRGDLGVYDYNSVPPGMPPEVYLSIVDFVFPPPTKDYFYMSELEFFYPAPPWQVQKRINAWFMLSQWIASLGEFAPIQITLEALAPAVSATFDAGGFSGNDAGIALYKLGKSPGSYVLLGEVAAGDVDYPGVPARHVTLTYNRTTGQVSTSGGA